MVYTRYPFRPLLLWSHLPKMLNTSSAEQGRICRPRITEHHQAEDDGRLTALLARLPRSPWGAYVQDAQAWRKENMSRLKSTAGPCR